MSKTGKSWAWWRKQTPRWSGLLAYHYKRCKRGDIDSEFLETLWAAQEGRCFYCEGDFSRDWVLEHLIPLCRGGTNHQENVAFACFDCDRRKQTQTAAEFTDGADESEAHPYVSARFRRAMDREAGFKPEPRKKKRRSRPPARGSKEETWRDVLRYPTK